MFVTKSETMATKPQPVALNQRSTCSYSSLWRCHTRGGNGQQRSDEKELHCSLGVCFKTLQMPSQEEFFGNWRLVALARQGGIRSPNHGASSALENQILWKPESANAMARAMAATACLRLSTSKEALNSAQGRGGDKQLPKNTTALYLRAVSRKAGGIRRLKPVEANVSANAIPHAATIHT